MDLELLITENYFTFLLLGGILIVMHSYRDVHLPGTDNFILIIAVLFLMAVSSSMEKWAAMSPDRINVRVVMSVIHYVLQPLVIFLELDTIMPEGKVYDGRKHLLALPLIINTVIYLIAPFTGTLVFSYDKDYCFNRGTLGSSIYIVTFFYLIMLLIWSIRLSRNKGRNSIILLFMIGAAVLSGILEGLNIVSGYIDETFALGVFMYYMYLVTVHESEMQAELAAEEIKLSQSKVRLLREQMQPHFIFNSLQIIKSLIRTDQKKAVLCLEDFSDYLKANLDAMKSEKLIPFEEELEHIEAYVSLALADDTKNIEILYEINEKDFLLPPFTVEPIMENALRHGVRSEGIIKIASNSDGNDYIVTVFDNGKGFSYPPESAGSGDQGVSSDQDASRNEAAMESTVRTVSNKEKNRRGIGIENARTRLETQCGGSLDIKTGEEGTTVIIRIPVSQPEGTAPDDHE